MNWDFSRLTDTSTSAAVALASPLSMAGAQSAPAGMPPSSQTSSAPVVTAGVRYGLNSSTQGRSSRA